jgi:hypothetical protein
VSGAGSWRFRGDPEIYGATDKIQFCQLPVKAAKDSGKSIVCQPVRHGIVLVGRQQRQKIREIVVAAESIRDSIEGVGTPMIDVYFAFSPLGEERRSRDSAGHHGPMTLQIGIPCSDDIWRHRTAKGATELRFGGNGTYALIKREVSCRAIQAANREAGSAPGIGDHRECGHAAAQLRVPITMQTKYRSDVCYVAGVIDD